MNKKQARMEVARKSRYKTKAQRDEQGRKMREGKAVKKANTKARLDMLEAHYSSGYRGIL